MNVYHIDQQNLTIIYGPCGVFDPYIKNLTHCGNPDLLPLVEYGVVPQIYPPLQEGYQYNDETTVYFDRVEMGQVVIPPPTPEQIIAILTTAGQNHLDSTARIRNYDGILSLCTYASSLDLSFSAEGFAGVQWRDACWRTCYDIMAEVQQGTRPVPTAEELIAELPEIVWP